MEDEAKLLHENKELSPPWFPNQGIVYLGQEQESLCGGFDNYDSLSANVSQFQASKFFLMLAPQKVHLKFFILCTFHIFLRAYSITG